jgi:uncharacterized protein YecT (DUF1311 family)
MKNPSRRLVALRLPVLFSALLVLSCQRSENKEAAPVVQDTMLLHDLAQANRNTAAADIDTTIPVIVRSRPTDGEVQEMAGVGGVPSNASQILTPSGTTPRPPRRANDAPAPTNIPPGDIAPASSDPCDSPAAEDQRTCLNRAIARSDVNLNRVYQDVIAQARVSGGSELEGRFRDQQRAWVFTRDDECRRQTRNQEGALWARVRARCLADYSARRTSELQESLNSLRGR